MAFINLRKPVPAVFAKRVALNPSPNPQPRVAKTAAVVRFKPKTTDLPRCIERVATALGAVYHPTPEQARSNLHADERSVRAYLGTYLPRTVHEFQTIGRDLLAHPAMRQAVPTHRPLRVLDVGSGTGGAWMGLVSALQSQGFKQPVAVQAVDGNALALSKQGAFAQAMAADMGVEIALTTTHCELGTGVEAFAADLLAVLQRLNQCFDFVLVSKHLSEFYCAAGGQANGVVYEALRLLQGALTPTGYLVVLDPTIRIDGVGEYFPNILARELGRYVDAHPQGVRPVLPVPCALNASGSCAGGQGHCFSQREMPFFHGVGLAHGVTEAKTKVAYRVLAPLAHARRVAAGYAKNRAYQVNARQEGWGCQRGQLVPSTGCVDGYVPLLNGTK